MALIHTSATLSPSKLALLERWLPTRPWFPEGAALEQVGAYRFDDPAGEVGLEAFLLRTGDGSVLHVPLSYRGAPLGAAEEFLVGTTEHSVLGTRWVYDGCADPVWVTALVATVLGGGTQASLVTAEGDAAPRESSARVLGSGTSAEPVGHLGALRCQDEGGITVVHGERLDAVVVRVVGTEIVAEETLTGWWRDGDPAVLAGVRARRG